MQSPDLPWMAAIAALVMVVILLLVAARKKTSQIENLSRENAVQREKISSAQREAERIIAGHREQMKIMAEERDRLRNSLQHEQRSLSELKQKFIVNETQLREQIKSARKSIETLEQTENRLNTSFENLANRIFDEKHLKFNEQSKTSVEALLSPMRQQLGEFRKRVDEVYDNENRQRATLTAEINQLKNLNERISTDALNLTNALKGDSKVRGNWGEVQLELLLEESGLKKGREYEVQMSLKDEGGKRFQPDAIVHLPESKDIVIDSKVSLVAYEAYHSAETDEEKARHLKEHLASIRTHIKQLSNKNYDELIGVRSLDLIIMFVPIEPALLLALEHEPGLYNEAFHQQIVLVSPTLLMATLQIIHNIWRYEHQNRNAVTIAEEAGKMYDHFVRFIEALDNVGSHLDKATESFTQAKKRLVDGRGNLISRTQTLQDLGAKAKKTIPRELLERSGDSDPE
ncbi:MAG: DNA recombination protein RmuC [Desulfofustis sp.]